MNNLSWKFSHIWNESLEQRDKKPITSRNNIWASELGNAPVDIYLKMQGVEPTNPPNARALRKFEAGNLMEWVVGNILKRAGIFKSTQDWVSFQYPDLLKVTGKLDYLAGGKIDWDTSLSTIKEYGLPELFSRATEAIIKYFQTQYPNGMDQIVIEVKSCASNMYDVYEKIGANQNHVLQAFHYLKALDMKEAHVVYISKDDLRILECGVFNDSETEKKYRDVIEVITRNYNNRVQPEKEKEILFDEVLGKFSTNWKLGYSNYLRMLYGYDDQSKYDEKVRPVVSKWNRTLKRIIDGAKMTKLNLQTIEEIKKVFPNFDSLVEIAKKSKVLDEEVEE